MSEILNGVRDYLSSGGLFNPELMDHQRTRDLIIECRDEIEQLQQKLATKKNQVEQYRNAFTRDAVHIFKQRTEIEVLRDQLNQCDIEIERLEAEARHNARQDTDGNRPIADS
jgi:chromosome segregation ATPase